MKEKIIKGKMDFYKKNYGENALREVILELEKNTYFGSSDYIEIIYYDENGTCKRLKVMGELTFAILQERRIFMILEKIGNHTLLNDDTNVGLEYLIDKKTKVDYIPNSR